MAENDRLARAPVLEEDLRAIGRGDRAHALLPPLVRALTPKRTSSQPNPPLASHRTPAPIRIQRDTGVSTNAGRGTTLTRASLVATSRFAQLSGRHARGLGLPPPAAPARMGAQ